MKLRFFALFAALFVCLNVACAKPMRVAGRVVNASREGANVAGTKLTLLRLNQSTQESESVAQTTARADGRFDFGTQNIAADDLLLVRATWQGQGYLSPAFDGAKQLGLGVELKPDAVNAQVFDTSQTIPELTFTAQHVAISTDEEHPNHLHCVERMVVENPTKTTFIGGGKEGVTVVLPLPKGATEVKLGASVTGAKLVKSGNVYGVNKAILPRLAGQQNAIIVEYSVPFEGGVADLSRKLQYGARFFFVAREEKDKALKITAPQLGKDETQPLPIGGTTENRIVNAVGQPMGDKIALPAGSDVKITVERETKPVVWWFVALVGVFLAAPLVLFLWNRLGKKSPPDKMAEPSRPVSVRNVSPQADISPLWDETPSAATRELVRQIAALDDDFEAGHIAREAYITQRGELKTRLLQTMTAQEAS